MRELPRHGLYLLLGMVFCTSLGVVSCRDLASAAPTALPDTMLASRHAGPGPSPVSYGRDVRPILADRCFLCHGPDVGTRKANLRLDRREEATAPRDGGAAIVPGDVEQSLLWQRLTHHDPADRMPPRDSGKRVVEGAELDILRNWIAAGAEYEPHWSFTPIVQPAAPTTAKAWSKNPIDEFVFAELAAHGLQPSPEADRATLVRRAFLVLSGLPPTPQELATALADTSPQAYEQLVDHLLQDEPYRTRCAEHIAQPWLDAARYADTSGIHMDAGRQIWPWRDWLIEAIRSDLPFDEFVLHQLAGDLLPGATQAQRVATGFLRAHVTTDEGGAIDEEYRVEYAAERTNTFGSVFLGLTVGCARCHDHKYDPFLQEDYYRLFSFFNSNQEPGLYSQSPDANRALEPALEVPSAADAAARDSLRAAILGATATLRDVPPEEARQREAYSQELAHDGGLQWQQPRVLEAKSQNGATLQVQPDGSVLASGMNPATDTHTITLVTESKDLRLLCLEAMLDPSFPEGRVGRAPNGNAVLASIHLATRPLGSQQDFVPVPLVWAFADYEQPDGDYLVTNALRDDELGWAVGAHLRPAQASRALFLAERPFGDAGSTEVRIELGYHSVYAQHTFGRVRLHLSGAAPTLLERLPAAASGYYVAGPFEGASPRAIYDTEHGPGQASSIEPGQRWGKLRWRYDGALRDATVHTNLPQGQNATYVGKQLYWPTARDCSVALGSDDGFQLFVGGHKVAEREVDRAAGSDQDTVKFAAPAGPSLLVLKVVNTGGAGGFYLRRQSEARTLDADLQLGLLPPATQDAGTAERWTVAWRERFSPDYAARRGKLDGLQKDEATLDAKMPRTMVMQEADTPRPTFILLRGEYDKPDPQRPVTRQLPSMFGELPAALPKNRLGLAKWLVSPQNPLLLRVAQNRLWEFVFGTGLVRTSEDFGLQGEWPSHRALLDWLAAEFRTRGLSSRAMLRLLVTSATFRQQSRAAEQAKAADPQDRLLGWFPRRRLTAESIRDQALFVAGLLVERTGGPSVKPYQPPGLWKEVAMLQSNTRTFQRDSGDALWRRSLYTYWKRACPPPSLLTLDAPTREFCTIRRSSTNTPLQALVLWNDEQFFEAARVLAQRTLGEPGDEKVRLSTMYERCTGKTLDPERMSLAMDLLVKLRGRYAAHPEDAEEALRVGEAPRDARWPAPELAAWQLVANAFLNLDSTLCID